MFPNTIILKRPLLFFIFRRHPRSALDSQFKTANRRIIRVAPNIERHRVLTRPDFDSLDSHDKVRKKVTDRFELDRFGRILSCSNQRKNDDQRIHRQYLTKKKPASKAGLNSVDGYLTTLIVYGPPHSGRSLLSYIQSPPGGKKQLSIVNVPAVGTTRSHDRHFVSA